MKQKEKRTQNLYNTLFHSGHIEEQFEEIIEECKKNRTKYKDPNFYPQKILNTEDEIKLKDQEWRRLEDQYPITLFDNVKPEAIIQGDLGDCYFITALIYASHHIELVKSLFHPKSSLKYGVVLVYFCYLGERIPVIVDTQVPYNKNSIMPSFCRPRTNEDSCWFVLVEKAYAKACGGYSFIQGGQISFGIHLMFDYFSAIYSPISEIIPIRSLEEEEKEITDSNDKIFQILTNLKDKKAMIGAATPEEYSESFNESIGIIKNHAYVIIDLKEIEKVQFIKLRNPWGKSKYKGPYSIESNELTEDLKNALNYNDEDDGSFWMPFSDFLRYFVDVNYSLQKEIGWKEMCVYGKIEGYLDGRSPCTNSPDVGCIPQWIIMFSKKTVVRFTYDFAGPESIHSLYICETYGRKVSRLNVSTKIMRTTSKASTNGIEYNVEDFTQPLTFFFTRIESNPEPCYYRILIQSPDPYYEVRSIDDNFVKGNCNSFTDSYVFEDDDDNDQWDPSKDERPLSTCKQWFIHFPDLRYDEKTELRFRVYKNISEGPLYLHFARTDQKLRYILHISDFQDFALFENFEIYSKSNYEEFSIPINRKYLALSDNDNSFHYVFAFYRKNKKDVDQFKFSVLSKCRFKCGVMPEPDRVNHCCYQIKGNLYHNENDGAIPNKQSIEKLKQWCLLFKENWTKLFIEYISNNTSSDHFIFLEKQKNKGDKIRLINRNSIYYHKIIPKNCIHDMIDFEIEDCSRPYALCVTRESSIDTSEFTLNIYGDEEFEMFEINENSLCKKLDKYHSKTNEKKVIDFPEFNLIKQPINFTPKKFSSKLKINSILQQKNKYSISDYILENITEQIKLMNPKKNDLQNIKEYHKFNLKFQLPNDNVIVIQNYNRMNFFEIFNSFNKEGFYFSEPCIRNNFYLFPVEDELIGEFYEKLEMDEANGQIVTLKYGQMQFILTENEMASEAYNLIRKAFDDSDSISILDNQNKKLSYISYLKINEQYTIHVVYQFNFKFSNGTFSTQYMDFLSTVSDAKKQLASLFIKNNKKANHDFIILFDCDLHELVDGDLMLKDTQSLKKLFHFDIDKDKLNSEKLNNEENKESEQNDSSKNELKGKSLSKNDEQKNSSEFVEEEEEPSDSSHSQTRTEISKQKNSSEFVEEEEEPSDSNHSQTEIKIPKQKNSSEIDAKKDESKDNSHLQKETKMSKQKNSSEFVEEEEEPSDSDHSQTEIKIPKQKNSSEIDAKKDKLKDNSHSQKETKMSKEKNSSEIDAKKDKSKDSNRSHNKAKIRKQKNSSEFIEGKGKEPNNSSHLRTKAEIVKNKNSSEFIEEEEKKESSHYSHSNAEKIKSSKHKSKEKTSRSKKEKVKHKSHIDSNKEESNDSLSFMNDSSLFNQSKPPKKRSTHGSKSSKERSQLSLSQSSNQEQPNQLLNIIFICDKFDEAYFNPIDKDLPLDTTIGEIQEMIANEFILPKDHLTIKYKDKRNKITIEPYKTVNDVKEKMIERQFDGKCRNYLYFDFGNTFTTIDKYKGTCMKTPHKSSDGHYKYGYYNNDKTYSPKILKSPIVNKKFHYHMMTKKDEINSSTTLNHRQQISHSSSLSSTVEPTSDKSYFVFEYEGNEIEVPFPDDLRIVNVENSVKKMLNIDRNEDVDYVVVKKNGEEELVDKNKACLNLLQNTKIKIYHKNQFKKPLISVWYKLDHNIFEIELDYDATIKSMKKAIAKLNKIKKWSRVRIFLEKQEVPDHIYLEFVDAEDHLFKVKIEEEEIFLITEAQNQSDEDAIEEEEEDI